MKTIRGMRIVFVCPFSWIYLHSTKAFAISMMQPSNVVLSPGIHLARDGSMKGEIASMAFDGSALYRTSRS